MKADLRITGGMVVTNGKRLDADVLVAEGKIAALVSRDCVTDGVTRTVDATGQMVLPGMIDVHVHTREPGYTHKEDIETTSRQAAAGGVTTMFGMPNLNPPTTNAQALRDVLDLYAEKSIVDYNHNPAATILDEIEAMADMGIRAFKVYMVVDTGRTYPHPAGTGMHDHGALLEMMDRIATTGKRFIIHPHDQALMNYIERSFLSKGDNTPQAYAQAYAARNGVIWDTAIEVVLRLAEASACKIHLAHIQTRRSVEAIRRAREHGVDVTCEVNHWLPYLSKWSDVERLGPYALSYVVPEDAREAVWEALRDGTIDMFSSDHAPHTREEKEIGWTQMWSAHTGTPGIQYFYPLILDSVNKGELTMERAIDLVATNPADRFGLAARKGSILPGYDADIVLADMNAPWVISNDGVLSKIGWTCYDGRKCSATITKTFVRGTEVFAGGEVSGAPGYGRQAVSA